MLSIHPQSPSIQSVGIHRAQLAEALNAFKVAGMQMGILSFGNTAYLVIHNHISKVTTFKNIGCKPNAGEQTATKEDRLDLDNLLGWDLSFIMNSIRSQGEQVVVSPRNGEVRIEKENGVVLTLGEYKSKSAYVSSNDGTILEEDVSVGKGDALFFEGNASPAVNMALAGVQLASGMPAPTYSAITIENIGGLLEDDSSEFQNVFFDTLKSVGVTIGDMIVPSAHGQEVVEIVTTKTNGIVGRNQEIVDKLRSILDTSFGPRGIHLQHVNGQDMIVIPGAKISVDDFVANVQNGDVQGALRAWIYEAQAHNLGGTSSDMNSASQMNLPADSKSLTVSAGPIVGNTAGSGLRFKTVYDSGTWSLGSEIILATELQSYFLAIGFQITQEVNGMISVAAVTQDAAKALGNSEYHGDLSAISLSAQVNYRNAFIRFLHEQGISTTLSEKSTISTTVTEEAFMNFIRTTTTTIKGKETTLWDAFSRTTLLAGYRWDIGENGQLVASAGVSNDPVNGTRPVGGADYTYYGDTWKASLGVHAQGKTRVLSATYTGQINEHWSGEAHLRYVPAQGPARASELVGVSLEYDSKPTSLTAEKKFVRPNADGTTPVPATLVGEAVDNPILKPNPTTLGEVKRIITETRATSSVDMARPAAPACTADDIANTINCGSLDPATLEVSMNGGTSWSGYSASATYPGNQTVLIRTKSSGSTPASMATSLTFTENIVLVDHAEVVTLPTPTITATSIIFVGGSVTDSDNPGGFTPSISYLVTDASGKLVSASSLTPNTAYAWQMQYTTYNGATNTLTVKKTVKQSFTTLDVAPVASGAFASLADMTVSDNAGFGLITINAGGVTDPLGRTITYSANGLPNDANGNLSINTLTGVISGIYDAQGAFGDITTFTVTITASNGTGQIQKTFTLSTKNDG
ncbi:MAG: hypothetical protein PHY14_02005 [Candidatus Gracilibacteria bacterium]|nr:hypothetical protein [Candidatus Gracilibacteria bacterium]